MYTRTATVRPVWWLWRWRIRWTGLQGLYVFTKSLRYICRKTSNIVRFKTVLVDYMDTCCTSGIVIWKSFRLIFQMSFFFFLVHILFVANDQASKHKKIPSCTGMVGCKYKVCHFKAVSHSSFKWRHMWKEDESLWRGCSVQSYKHKCNLPLQTWLSEKSQKQKVWRYCQTIFPDSVSVQKNDSLLYLRGDVDLDFQCKGVVCNFCDIKQNCNLFVWVILCLTTLAEPGSEINGFKMPQKIKLENPCNDEFLYFWYIWYINVIYFTIFCVRPT